MQRAAIKKLKVWKDKKGNKPLIIEDARRIGKTWLMKEFEKQYYKQVVYLHFDNNPELAAVFENDYKIPRLIEAFEILSGIKINPDDTLIIFDEVQECTRVFTSLKYFNENVSEHDIIAVGNLLGLVHHKETGFSVEKVSFLNLYPMDFFEFSRALGEERFIELIEKKDFQMISTFKNEFEKLVKMYCYIGGIPEVVQDFINNRDYKKVREIQEMILASYENGFLKHVLSNTVEKIRMLWRTILSQLAKENKTFIYNAIKKGARAKEYELALLWLKDSGLCQMKNAIYL